MDNDKISRQALLDEINEEIEYGEEHFRPENEQINKGLKIARKLVRAAPSVDNGWISVKDRLPDECEEVLIYCPEFLEEIRKAFYTEGDFYIEKEDLIVKPAPNGYCTHWRPLPEPPKGE